MKTIIAAYSQNRSGSRASIQAALRTLLTAPWPSQRDVRSWLQLLAVLQWVLSFLLLGVVSLLLLIYLVFTSFWPISALYLAWIIFDWDTPEKGGRRLACLRKWSVWKHFRDYFPVQEPLLETCSLSPLAMACSPVGDGGPLPVMVTRSQPHGGRQLPHGWSGAGTAVVIVIGGAAESLSCQPGVTTLILKNRKGFVRMALQHGAYLVPSFSFGENDLFRQVVFKEGSWMRSIQQRFQKMMGFAPCVFYGRGLTSVQSRGFLPYARPITTIVGEPMTVPKIEDPSCETVDLYHEMYVRSLLKLFNENKTKYGLSETDELRIV
nr:PREDICTED: diacylglycerol O-acyltransferase 2-like [Struthio camelus australis]